jgi:hypothetical protein
VPRRSDNDNVNEILEKKSVKGSVWVKTGSVYRLACMVMNSGFRKRC